MPARPIPQYLPPAPPPVIQAPVRTSSGRSTFYKTEPAPGILPASAALASPIAAQDQKTKTNDAPKAESKVDVELPGPDKLFRLESEKGLQERVIADRKREGKTALRFPAQDPISTAPYQPRLFAGMTVEVEPHYVCFGRLLFEDKNSERYGWDLGPIQPFVSAARFYGDLSNLPYKFCSFPRLRYDCSAGHCLPGDPVPYMEYPQGLSATGALAQAGVTVALYFIFP